MRTSSNAILYNYWNSVRGSRLAPRRFEIEPSRIADVLAETLILEFQEPASFIYRLAGTRICEITGREMRGSNFLEGWRDTDRFALQRHLTSVRKLGAVTRVLVEGSAASGQSARFELLVLPLLHNADSIDRFLGGFVPLKAEPWLGETPVVSFRILETELTYPADGFELPEPVLRSTPQANTPPPVLPSVRSARIVRQDRRQFRVYDGGLSQGQDKPS